MKHLSAGFVALYILFSSTALLACPQCRSTVKSEVYNGDFAVNLFVLLLPLAVLFVIGIGLYFSDTLVAKLRQVIRR